METHDLSSRLGSLRAEIALKYGVGGSLGSQVRAIRRTLPKYERRQAESLVRVEAALEAGGADVDPQAFERAETALLMHLDELDAAARRTRRAVDIAMNVLVNLVLAVAALLALWLYLGPD
ncbi:MAG: hypothetical protein AAF714_03360 [Pseudomonadota bacterium]